MSFCSGAFRAAALANSRGGGGGGGSIVAPLFPPPARRLPRCSYASREALAAHQRSAAFLDFGRRVKAGDFIMDKAGEAFTELAPSYF